LQSKAKDPRCARTSEAKDFDNKQLSFLFYSFLSDNKDSVGSATRRDERRQRERERERERERAAEGFKFAAGCFDKMQQDGCEIYKSELMFGKSRRSARIIVILSQSSVYKIFFWIFVLPFAYVCYNMITILLLLLHPPLLLVRGRRRRRLLLQRRHRRQRLQRRSRRPLLRFLFFFFFRNFKF
jgi:hypothetical protein